MNKVQTYLYDFFSLFYPRLCYACQKALLKEETLICSFCEYQLPQTFFYKERDNAMSRIFWGRVEIETATALLYFQKGSMVQRLVHQFKYKGRQEVGRYLGKLLGIQLHGHPLWEPVTMIIPVPLHEKRQQERGFNQSEVFGQGLARALKKPLVVDNLVRVAKTTTQTRKTRFKRWENVETVFQVNDPEAFRSQNILLIDDVITTGSTLEACAQKLSEIKGVRIWVATLAMSI